MTVIETKSVEPARHMPAPATPWGEAPDRQDVWPSAAQELLLRAALTPDERALAAWQEIRSQIDIATLDGTTQALLPVLRKNLLALGVEDELINLFKGVHRYSWARNQMLLAPMMPVVAVLERAGVQTMLLKGAAFVADRRLDAGMRSMNDVDVLVRSDRVGEAITVLLESGLTPVGEVPPWYVEEYAPRFVPSHGFRDVHDRQLDLHWHVLHASCQAGADDEFWAAAQDIELLGVSTRALCASDELLLVILHGLRWNEIPTYRWVVDAALLCSGAIGAIDYGRLAEQGLLRRVSVALQAGLEYLHRVLGIPVPESCLDALAAARPSRLERLEFEAQVTQPRRRSRLQWEVIYHQQHARRELPLGRHPTFPAHLSVARARLGVETVKDLRRIRSGGRPGPSRPDSEMAAAVGVGAEQAGLVAALGEPIELGEAESARACSAYGTWRAEGPGCWIAGQEARLVLLLAEPPRGSLILEISADGFLPEGIDSQRLGVAVNGVEVAELQMNLGGSLRGEVVHLPAAAVRGCQRLEFVLRAPDAVSPARLGIGDDDRLMGVFLRSLLVRKPCRYRLGSQFQLGEDSQDVGALLGAWGASEPSGRWTTGPLTGLLLDVGEPVASSLELEFDAIPFLAPSQQKLTVEVMVGGRRVQTVRYEGDGPAPSASRVLLPSAAMDDGEILLGWQIREPRSPRSLGVSDDPRLLGLFIRNVTIRTA
jgi:Uncharacterised nucleotidyltransferase